MCIKGGKISITNYKSCFPSSILGQLYMRNVEYMLNTEVVKGKMRHVYTRGMLCIHMHV